MTDTSRPMPTSAMSPGKPSNSRMSPGVAIHHHSTGAVIVRLSRDHFQALKECFGIGFEQFPDCYPYGVQAEEVQHAIEVFIRQEEEA